MPSSYSLQDAAVHCTGSFAQSTGSSWHPMDHALVRSETCSRSLDTAGFYKDFFSNPEMANLGADYRRLEQIFASSSLSLGKLKARNLRELVSVHPGDLDAAISLKICVADEVGLPFAISESRLQGSNGRVLWTVRQAPAKTLIAFFC